MSETILTTEDPKASETPAPAVEKPADDKVSSDPKAGDKPAEGEGAAKDPKGAEGDKEKSGAPEKYEFKVPEGVELDEALVGEFTPVAKELGLSQEGAQKLVDLYSKQRTADVQKLHDAWAKTHEEWTADVKSDKEFGGAALEANLAIAKKAINSEFGGKDLVEALNVTGAGNHPAIVRFFYKLGKAMANDKFEIGGSSSNQPRDPARALYPTMQQ